MISSDSSILRCQVCGRQDETLRLVAYPFVFSVVVMSFQRQFSGLWCRRHRLQYWLQAGLITSIFGWFGIPYGLILTPTKLFQLMRGGIQPAEANAVLLKDLGINYVKDGNPVVAIECFESSLQYMDTPEVRDQLRRLYGMNSMEESTGWLKNFLLFTGISFVFGFLGFLVGLVDYFLSSFMGGILGSSNLIVVIFMWTPIVTMIFLSISLLRCVIEWAVRYGRKRKLSFSLALSVVSMVLLINGVATGEALGDLVRYASSGTGFESPVLFILAMIITLFVGGFEYIVFVISDGQVWGYIMDALLLTSLVAGLVILWQKSHGWSKWQTILAELRGIMF